MRKMELWLAVILIGLGIAGFIYSITLPLMGPIALCPGLFPGFVTSLMIVLGTAWLIQLLKSRTEPLAVKPAVAGDTDSAAAAGSGISQEDEGEEGDGSGSRNMLVLLAFFILYLVLLNYARFLISTILFLFGTMMFLYRKFHWKIPVISVVTTFGVYFLFRELLNVRLP